MQIFSLTFAIRMPLPLTNVLTITVTNLKDAKGCFKLKNVRPLLEETENEKDKVDGKHDKSSFLLSVAFSKYLGDVHKSPSS